MVMDTIGQPNATSCAAHSERYDGMPIEIVSLDGKHLVKSICTPGFPGPQDGIHPSCSYEWQGEGQPKFNALVILN